MSYVAVRILSASLSVRSWMDGRHIEGYCKLFHLLHLCRLIFFGNYPITDVLFNYYCLIHHFWLMWLAVSLGAYFIYLFKSLMTKKIRTLLFFRASLRLLCFPFPLPRPVFCHHHHL